MSGFRATDNGSALADSLDADDRGGDLSLVRCRDRHGWNYASDWLVGNFQEANNGTGARTLHLVFHEPAHDRNGFGELSRHVWLVSGRGHFCGRWQYAAGLGAADALFHGL